MVSGLFDTKKSSVERGKVWVADKLCDIKEPTFKVDQRAVRDHYKKLITRFKRKQREEDLASRISPEDNELDSMLEEMLEREEAAEMQQNEDDEKKKRVEADKVAADDLRRKAMEKLSDTKKRKGQDSDKPKKKKVNTETLKYLREKTASEMNIRKEELELKKADNELKEKKMTIQLEQQNNVMKMLIDQQQQQHQQNQTMHMMMLQQQQQQTQALLAMIEKIAKWLLTQLCLLYFLQSVTVNRFIFCLFWNLEICCGFLHWTLF